MSISEYYMDEIDNLPENNHASPDEILTGQAAFDHVAALVDNNLKDVSTEHKRFADAYYNAIFEDQDNKHIQYCKNQMDHLQQLANDGQEYIVNF